MARKRKTIKAKEPVRLRVKTLANGNKSIYLDQYQEGRRTYEFLKLYLVPEVDEAAKAQNVNTMQAANAIKAQRIIELTNSGAGVTSKKHLAKMLLSEWMGICQKKKTETGLSESAADQIRKTVARVEAYRHGATLEQVDTEFCRGFYQYLKEAKKSNGEHYTAGTIHDYFNILCIVLSMAAKKGIITNNPIKGMEKREKPQQPESTREFLTVEEVKKLMAAKCRHEVLRRAFLFSCFCGLRRSDIEGLTWGDIQKDGDNVFLRIIVKKTGKPILLPLSAMALRWIPERGNAKDNDRVFPLPTYSGFYGSVLSLWAANAGIKKKVTFHVARHTFATMGLTAGADLYTVSKLLGHAQISTTQIYAKIIDKKKAEAVDMVSNLFDEGKEAGV